MAEVIVPPGKFIATGITATAAVQLDDGGSYVFYSKTGTGILSCLYYDGAEASPVISKEPEYKHKTITDADFNPFQASAPQLAAVAYGNQIRVYYINESNFLRELCYTVGGKGWTNGSLDNTNTAADHTAPLSASVSGSRLKLYYTRPDSPGMWITWCSVHEQAWFQRAISEK